MEGSRTALLVSFRLPEAEETHSFATSYAEATQLYNGEYRPLDWG